MLSDGKSMIGASNLCWRRPCARRGLRCKWIKDIRTLFLKEFVHLMVGDCTRAHDE